MSREVPQFCPVNEILLHKDLEDARSALRRLPGIENYVPPDSRDPSQIDGGLDKLVNDLSLQLDAENMIPMITNRMGWSAREAEAFFTDHVRQPFQSMIEFSRKPADRMRELLTIGIYLRLRYQEIKKEKGLNNQETKDAADNLKTFVTFSSINLFQSLANDFTDRVNGINPEDRRSGNMHTTDEMTLFMQEETRAVPLSQDLVFDTLYKQVLAATEGGNFATVWPYLINKKGKLAVRQALRGIITSRMTDRQLTLEKIQLIWSTEIYRQVMGIDLELFYEINHYPAGKIIEARLHKFLQHPDLVKEVWQHVEEEARPAVLEAEETGAPLDIWQILDARAEHHHFPDEVSSPRELEEKRQRVWGKLREILPLASEFSRGFLAAPTVMGANLRAYNMTYENKDGQLISVIIVDPRDREVRFAENTAHELTHQLHTVMLEYAWQREIVAKDCWKNVLESTQEAFAGLVQSQVGLLFQDQEQSQPVEPVAEAGETAGQPTVFRDLLGAIGDRRQAPFALTQLAVRREMDQLWKQEKTGWQLSDDEAGKILDKVQPQLTDWMKEGVPIEFPIQTVLRCIEILDPFDGLLYLGEYLGDEQVPQSETPGPSEIPLKKQNDIETAFVEKFKKKLWLTDQNARAVLLALFVESGKNYNIATYGDFVRKADPAEWIKEFESWGINRDLI